MVVYIIIFGKSVEKIQVSVTPEKKKGYFTLIPIYIYYGPVKANELWRIRQNDELEAIIKGENTVRFIKCQRIRWLGHIERMQDTEIPEKIYGKLYATRRRGRPRMRWLDDVSMDLRKMGVNEWRDTARNREAWRHIVEEAKAHPGL